MLLPDGRSLSAKQRGMPDNPIGIADRRKRIAWGVPIRAGDARVIGGNDQRKIGDGKTLRGLVRDNRGCAFE